MAALLATFAGHRSGTRDDILLNQGWLERKQETTAGAHQAEEADTTAHCASSPI